MKAWCNDLMPTEQDVRNADRRQGALSANLRQRVAWFWKPLAGHYEFRVMENGYWVVLKQEGKR